MTNEIERIKSLEHKLNRLENDKLYTLQQEISLLRSIVDFQNTKIDKLTNLIESKHLSKHQQDEEVLDAFGNDDIDVDTMPGPMSNNQNSNDSSSTQLNNLQMSQQQQQQQQRRLHDQHIHNNISYESNNMDPALQRDLILPPIHNNKHQSQKSVENIDESDDHDHEPPPTSQKRKKIEKKMNIVFLHNPTTVKEIYDEFFKGYKGQEPLFELDTKYGKHIWRGDSRSKESKRFQRRKKLCDAIQRGMMKYGKSSEEIIDFIEKFRGDRSLTWIMNGHLPPDLL